MYCSRCGENNDNSAKFCRKCGAPLVQNQNNAPIRENLQMNTYTTSQKTQGMKWYKFIIYVQLILLPLSEIVNCYLTFSKKKLGDYTYYIYSFSPGIRMLDIFSCLAGIVILVAAIYVRMQLAGFKKGAPQKYLLLLVGQTARGIIYILGLSVLLNDISGIGYSTSFEWLQIVSLIVMVIVNHIYFDKRKQYFVK